jgi:hypothetical protein
MEKTTIGLLLAQDLETTADEDREIGSLLYAIPHGRPL